MFNFWNRHRAEKSKALLNSTLHDENSFYKAFLSDLKCCQKELVIESPYITASRMATLYPILVELRCRGTLTDRQIVEEINNLGYRTRTQLAAKFMMGARPGDKIQIPGFNGTRSDYFSNQYCQGFTV